MERVLRLLGIIFEREIKFKRFHVDFLIDKLKLVIECDGEHWHMSPRIQDRDRRKEEYLQSLGYRVLRFSGRQITNFSEASLANQVKRQIFLSV
jgi:very-short-patch-repair endonuclease